MMDIPLGFAVNGVGISYLIIGGEIMDERKYEIMKEMVLALNEFWNTPNVMLEVMFGMSWDEYHALRRALEEEE